MLVSPEFLENSVVPAPVVPPKVVIRPENHLGLARRACLPFVPRGVRLEDSDEYGDALLFLVEAAHEYNPALGSFSNWAIGKIRKRLVSKFKNRNAKKRKADFAVFDVEEIIQPEKLKPLDASLLAKYLRDYRGERPDDRFSKQILMDYFLKNKKVTEIAAEMGVSRERVYQRINRAIVKIRQRFEIEVGKDR